MWNRSLLISMCASLRLLTGCNSLPASSPGTWTNPLSYVTDPRPVLTQRQEPWQLSVQGLSEATLRQPGDGLPATTDSPLTTVAIKLRLQGQDSQRSLPELLATQAPTYSPEQAQEALFYHMAGAGYLQVGSARVRPHAAYVEMTTQREQCVDLVFVFALSRHDLAQVTTTRFVVDNAFFLAQPVTFTLPTTQFLPAS